MSADSPTTASAEATTAETLARMRHTLDQVQPGDTLILAHHNAQGGILTHTLGSDPARLADTARTLLDQALDLLHGAARGCARQGKAPQAWHDFAGRGVAGRGKAGNCYFFTLKGLHP